MRALLIALGMAAVTASPAPAQVGAKGPSSTETAAANAAAVKGVDGFRPPTSGAPNILVSGSSAGDNCAAPISAAVGTVGLSLAAVGVHIDRSCTRIRTVKMLEEVLRLHDAAIAYACQDPAIREAMSTAGTPCAAPH